MAHYDHLTQLPNRAYYMELLEEAIVALQERNSKLAILFVDLDRFKQINDSSSINKIHEPVTFDGYEFLLSASIGIAMYPTSSTSSNMLPKNADVSMHEVKRSGRGWYKVHMPSSNKFAYERLKLENDLHKALKKRDELYLEYQMQFSVESAEIGAEALLRWQHPVLGQVSPTEFISLAEESGLIVSVGE